MTDTLTIRTNRHRYELVSYAEAYGTLGFKPSYFGYIMDEDRYSERLFRYRGEWYDVDEFSPAPATVGADNQMIQHLPGWDAFQSDSYFSGIAVKFLTGDDDGFVQVATVYS